MTYLMAIALKQKQNQKKKDENQKKKINCKVQGTNGLPAWVGGNRGWPNCCHVEPWFQHMPVFTTRKEKEK